MQNIKTSAVTLVLLAFAAAPAAAQQRADTRAVDWHTAAAAQPALAATLAHTPLPITAQPSNSRMAVGGVLGGAAGFLAGGLVGAVIGGNRCAEEGNPDSCKGLEGAAIGGVAGMSLGIPVGAHLANHRRGNLLASVAVSLVFPLIVGGIAEATGEDRVYAAMLLVPPAQVLTSVMIEGRTTR